MIQINGVEKLDEFILDNIDTNVVVLYFGATWCQPCKLLKTRLEEDDTKNMMPKLAVCYLDVDNETNEKLSEQYNVDSLPTQIFIKLKNDRVVEVGRIEGYNFTSLKSEYDKYTNMEGNLESFQ